jgi:hypothetical protein
MDIVYEIFSLIIFIIGFVLIQSSITIDNVLKDQCVNSTLRTVNKIILIIAVISMGITVGNVLCRLSCECSGEIWLKKEFYIFVVMLLGIAILTLGIIIKTNSTGLCVDAGPEASRIIILGSTIVAFCFMFFLIVYFTSGNRDSTSTYSVGGGLNQPPAPKISSAKQTALKKKQQQLTVEKQAYEHEKAVKDVEVKTEQLRRERQKLREQVAPQQQLLAPQQQPVLQMSQQRPQQPVAPQQQPVLQMSQQRPQQPVALQQQPVLQVPQQRTQQPRAPDFGFQPLSRNTNRQSERRVELGTYTFPEPASFGTLESKFTG